MHHQIRKIKITSSLVKKFLLQSDAGMVLFIEILIGTLLTSFGAVFFAKLSHSVWEQQRFLFDSSIAQFIVSFRTNTLTEIMIVISMIGSTGIVVASLLILAYLFVTKHRKEAVIYSAIVIMGAGINAVIKLIIQRPRPGELALVTLKDFSFPSGHSMDSFVFFLTIAYFTFHFTRSKAVTTFVSIISVSLIFLIGVSRVYLGVHYPSDVLGGYLAGFIWFTTIIIVDRTLIFYRLFKESGKTKIM
jgi:undecaprenyl-diphosphatase